MRVRNKEKQAEYRRKHYLANKESVIAKAKISNVDKIKRNKKYVKNYLESHPCVDCGEKDLIVLEFDHVRGTKTKDIGVLKGSACSIKTLQTEIDKCDVRCANCHRRVTYNRRNASLAQLVEY